jgi:hypothetical protein
LFLPLCGAERQVCIAVALSGGPIRVIRGKKNLYCRVMVIPRSRLPRLILSVVKFLSSRGSTGRRLRKILRKLPQSMAAGVCPREIQQGCKSLSLLQGVKMGRQTLD